MLFAMRQAEAGQAEARERRPCGNGGRSELNDIKARLARSHQMLEEAEEDSSQGLTGLGGPC